MRWTIRGISEETADAVRDVAYRTGATLGDVVGRCVRIGLPEARRQLESVGAAEGGETVDHRGTAEIAADIGDILSKILGRRVGQA